MVRTFFALGGLMLCLGLFSCYDENGTYGSDLVDSAFRNVRIDTSTVVVTSVLIDSLETSGKNVALVGRYKHSLWGSGRDGRTGLASPVSRFRRSLCRRHDPPTNPLDLSANGEDRLKR